mmetsp:Transcript_38456/g.96678  ORF Transcript_38456/g.96678 Transcript_38456/m.96678 type:complete len:220 (-) Transcript_38456:300-959(-)
MRVGVLPGAPQRGRGPADAGGTSRRRVSTLYIRGAASRGGGPRHRRRVCRRDVHDGLQSQRRLLCGRHRRVQALPGAGPEGPAVLAHRPRHQHRRGRYDGGDGACARQLAEGVYERHVQRHAVHPGRPRHRPLHLCALHPARGLAHRAARRCRLLGRQLLPGWRALPVAARRPLGDAAARVLGLLLGEHRLLCDRGAGGARQGAVAPLRLPQSVPLLQG